MTTPKTALLPYIISLPVKFYPDFSPFQISVMNQFIHINRYQICLDPTISLSVLYSGLFARNNRISNASFPNRFNPSVKHFNFELIIHNPCHNSTTSRIKINNPVCLGILPVNSYWTATLVTPSLGAFGVGLQAEGFPCKDRNTREACVARCRLVSAIKPSV